MMASPFFGIYATTEWASRWSYGSDPYFSRGFGRALIEDDPTWPLIWIGVYSAIALILAFATLRTFDRCLGRVPEDAAPATGRRDTAAAGIRVGSAFPPASSP